MEGSFLVRLTYDDEITYKLVGSAEKVLSELCRITLIAFDYCVIPPNTIEIPANEILELFGRLFFDFCQESGYDRILQVLGATPRDFLQNLVINHSVTFQLKT